MSTTLPYPLKPGHDVRMEPIHAAYVAALGDLDKASDIESAAYHAGEVDAYFDVLFNFDAIEVG